MNKKRQQIGPATRSGRCSQLKMSTKLWLDSVSDLEINNNLQGDAGEYIELSEGFLYEVIVNEELLRAYLSEKEIELIRPNWGEIELKSTKVLKGKDRENYLSLLQEVMRTNSTKNLDLFLYEKGITSDKLVDRAKSPQEILKVLNKIVAGLGKDHELSKRFKSDINTFRAFLRQKIQNGEKILIEFVD